MTTQTTPGPWKIALSGKLHYLHVRSSDGLIADVGASARYPKESEANARLIAAAPDLLEALKMILPLAEEYLKSAPSHPDNAKLESARGAIVKASHE